MRTNPKAISSFRLGLLSFILSAFTGIPAIIQGVRALWDIQRNQEQPNRKRLALAGIGTGMLGTCLGIGLLLLAIEKVRDAADRAT